MSTAENPLVLPRARSPFIAGVKRVAASPRVYVYLSCTVLAVLTSYHLGKEMLWDTMDYHVYAGFSALHDRFGQDYFAAGPQGYFNPYVYVPFYLLLRSPFTPLEDASILAALQSAILWLTFELALLVVPRDKPKVRLAAGMLAVGLALANPVLINELGSSFADITTAEIALAGWFVLLGAVRTPTVLRIVCAALLLGGASALKLTNSVHAISAAVLVLFLPGQWRSTVRYAALFVAGVAVGFLIVTAPWSLRLEQHFSNPLFPLLNGVFRSPDFTTASILDYRFIPECIGAALLRPFAMLTSAPMVHFELPAPDVRYAFLFLLMILFVIRWAWSRVRRRTRGAESPEQALATRVLAALGCGFLVDWTLWLTVSANSRYFLPMACVAAVLGVALAFRLFAGRPKVRNYVLATVLCMQGFALYAGTDYRAWLPWTNGPWFTLSVPPQLASQPSLYFLIGIQSNSFIIPDLSAGSGFVNLDGAFVLGSHGASGERIRALIARYAPHLRVLVRDVQAATNREVGLPDRERVDDALRPFGLRAVASRCSIIVVHGVTAPLTAGIAERTSRRGAGTNKYRENLVTCAVRRVGAAGDFPIPDQAAADLALDHLEDACPALFQPPRLVDLVSGDRARGYVFARLYSDTGTMAWVARGTVRFEKLVGGREESAGTEREWVKAPPSVWCGRDGQGYLRIREKRRGIARDGKRLRERSRS